MTTPLEICESRDSKGLYRKARLGELAEFAGISSPYEAPEQPALTLDTSNAPLAECASQIMALIEDITRL